MNKNIKQVVLVIIGLIVVILVYLISIKEIDLTKTEQIPSVNLQQHIQPQTSVTYDSYKPITGQKNKYWTQISGDAGDTCTRPTFIGKVNISGWYEKALFYTEEEWLFRVSSSDIILLPWDLLIILGKPWDGGGDPYVRITNITPQSESILKQANPQKPVSVTVTKFSQYCEGRARIEIDNSSIVY